MMLGHCKPIATMFCRAYHDDRTSAFRRAAAKHTEDYMRGKRRAILEWPPSKEYADVVMDLSDKKIEEVDYVRIMRTPPLSDQGKMLAYRDVGQLMDACETERESAYYHRIAAYLGL